MMKDGEVVTILDEQYVAVHDGGMLNCTSCDLCDVDCSTVECIESGLIFKKTEDTGKSSELIKDEVFEIKDEVFEIIERASLSLVDVDIRGKSSEWIRDYIIKNAFTK